MLRRRHTFFLPLLLILGLIPVSWPFHGSVCIGRRSQDKDDDSLAKSDVPSIGSGAIRVYKEARDLFTATYIAAKNTPCFNFDRPHTLTVYPIKYRSSDVENPESNVLFGWFHLNLKAHPDGISTIALQPIVRLNTEPYAPGDFVSTDFNDRCKETMGTGAKKPDLSYRQALAPCYFTPNPSTTVPRAFAYAIKSGTDASTKLFEASLNFRTDFPECGQISETMHMEFLAFASTDMSKVGNCTQGPRLNPLNHSKIFFNNKVYGGYDPEPPKGHGGVSCDEVLATGNPDWVSKYEGEATFPPTDLRGECYGLSQLQLGQSFVGRCGRDVTGNSNWHTSHSTQYSCDSPHPGVIVLPPFKPPLPGGGINCTDVELQCKEEVKKVLQIGISANSNIGRYVWSFRTTHGIAMSLTTMFVIPVGTLFARFFKETHMNSRFINIHVWYGIHISLGMTGFSGLLSGAVAAVFARTFFGYSWHPVAYYHDICGWISLILFVVSLANAPLRSFMMMYRKLMIFAHFFTASLARILFTFCLISSFYISASPAALNDVDMGFKFGNIVIVIVWIVVDVAVHLFLQFQLCTLAISKKRKYALGVPIPVIRPYATEDVPKSQIRNILMLFHAVLTFACACLLSMLMCLRDPEGHRFGKMGYTHKPNGKLNKLFTDSADGDNER